MFSEMDLCFGWYSSQPDALTVVGVCVPGRGAGGGDACLDDEGAL